MLQQKRLRSCATIVLLALISFVLPISVSTAAEVVGNGMATSCTEAAFDAALATGGLIFFDCGGVATITVNSEKLITTNVLIDGAGQITFSATAASPATRIFSVQAGGSLTLQGLTLIGGNAGSGDGGAILNAGTLQLNNVTVRNNQAQRGGAIHNSGTLTLNGVTLSENQAERGGAIYTLSPALGGATNQLVNATLSSNTGSLGGGAIYNDLSSITLLNSTLANNAADGGGNAIWNATGPGGAVGSISVQNSILGAGTIGVACVGSLTSAGNNIASDTSCALSQASDKNATNPVLGSLQQNGGPTQTHAPLAGSPALDLANPDTCPSIDQRGQPRPFGTHCDSGAVEVQQAFDALTGPWYVTPTGSDANPCNQIVAPCQTINGAISKASSGDLIYVATANYASASGDEVVRITKKLILSGGWNSSFTNQTGMSTINGRILSVAPPLGQRGVTITDNADVTMIRFAVQNGAAPLDSSSNTRNGGGIFVKGTLHGSMLDISNNYAERGAGVHVEPNGAAYFSQSSIYANVYAITGGGINAQNAIAVFVNSTISSNEHNLYTVDLLNFQGTEIDSNQGALGLFNSTVVSASSAPLLARFVIRNNQTNFQALSSILVGPTPCENTNGIISLGNNIESQNTCGFTSPSDKPNTDPNLSILQDNGGPTPTHALLYGSKAIDTATKLTTATDQRGVLRPNSSRSDSGAYEYNAVTTTMIALPFSTRFPVGLTSAQGIVTSTFPAGSLAIPAILEYIPHDNPPTRLPIGRIPINSFSLQAHQLPTGTRTTVPTPSDVPVGVAFSLNISYKVLPDNVPPTSLQLLYYNQERGVWIELPSHINISSQTVVADTKQFGTFALVGGSWKISLPVVVR